MVYYQLLGKRTLVSLSLSPPSYVLTTAVDLVYWCSPEYGVGQIQLKQGPENQQRK